MADLTGDDRADDPRPLDPPPRDPRALRGALGLALPPAVFLAHFSLLYGVNALLCRFDLAGRTLVGLPPMAAVAALATLAAVAALLAAAHGARNRGTEGQVSLEYDQPARHDFVVKARVMLSWLTVAAMLLVTLPVLVARTCS
jgi:hypothetical protein